METATDWMPPETFEEKLKRLLVPGPLYIRYLYQKSLRRGERELTLIPSLADRERVSLDVGANKGIYSFALLPWSRQVHAFEPNPKLFRILSGWARNRVVLHDLALSDETADADLLIPRGNKGYSNQGASLSAIKVRGDHGRLTVRAKRLDDLDIEDVGFMKIDVEGAELAVIQGARRTIERDRPVLMVELEERHTLRPIADMIGEVCDLGYQCRYLKDNTLVPFETLDPARQHSDPFSPDYVFNFIFMPKGAEL